MKNLPFTNFKEYIDVYDKYKICYLCQSKMYVTDKFLTTFMCEKHHRYHKFNDEINIQFKINNINYTLIVDTNGKTLKFFYNEKPNVIKNKFITIHRNIQKNVFKEKDKVIDLLEMLDCPIVFEDFAELIDTIVFMQ